MAAYPRIGFAGIGLMGGPMAGRLLAEGLNVTVWNRTASKAEVLSAGGARVVSSAADCARDAEIFITMLESGDAVHAVLFEAGAAEALPPGAVVVDMSSIGADEARTHAAELGARGIAHLDAPVSGGTVGAEAGSLAIMVGGSQAAFHQVAPVLELMGRPVLVGPAGAGQVAKLANQMIVANTIGAVAEALVFAASAGADPGRVREALRGGFADSRILDLHGSRMVAGDFEARGRTSIQIKDLVNASRAARAAGAATPYTGLSLELFRELLETEGDLDHSGLWLTLNARAAADRRAGSR